VADTWPEEDLDDDCKSGVRRGACYLAFPKCDSDDKPLATCKSFCENERIACRTLNSNFGTRDMIEGYCGGPDWYPGVGPSPECTGASKSLYAGRLSVIVPAIACVATAALWQAVFT